jgi:geranylgeranyl pyrophosphate synthase
LGGIVAECGPDRLALLDDFGSQLGLAFQIVDDLLDVAGQEGAVGKRVGKDAGRGKVTFPTLLGVDASRRHARELISKASAALEPFGPSANQLRALATFVLDRTR